MKELSVIYRGFGESVLLGILADDGQRVLAHAKTLPLARSTIDTVHQAMNINHARLAK